MKPLLKPIIPLKKHIFYRQVYEALFETHDLSKDEGGFTRKKKTGLSVYDFELVVRSLGFVSLQTSRVEYSKDELLQLAETAKVNVPTINFDPQNLLKDLSIAVPLFTVDGTMWRWSHRSLQEYFAALYVSAQGQEFQQRILTAMYESSRSLNYVNFLSLFADIESKGFRHIFVRRALSDLEADFNLPACRPKKVAERDLHERWRLTCMRTIVHVYISPDRFSPNWRFADMNDAARHIASANYDYENHGMCIVIGENPFLAILSTPRIELILELCNRGILDVSLSAGYEPSNGTKHTLSKYHDRISWHSGDEDNRVYWRPGDEDEHLLQERADKLALINQPNIYNSANDLINVRGIRLPIDPETLAAALTEIELEVVAHDRREMNF